MFIAVQALAALVFVAYLLISDGVSTPLADRVTLRAEFADAAGLRTDNHSPVTVAGVPAGSVESVTFDGGVAVAELTLDAESAEVIGAQSTARIISRSALQDLEVEIDPGPGEPLADGSTIPAAKTSSTVGSDRVVSMLDADTRAQMQVLLPQLAVGLRGRAPELRADLEQLGTVVDSTGLVAKALADRRRELVRFVDELNTIVTRLAERREQLGDAVDAGQETLAVTAARDRELDAVMADLPSTLDDVNAALDAVDDLSQPLVPALEQLQPVAQQLPPALDSVRDLLPEGSELVDNLDDLSTRGAEPVAHLRDLLRDLGPASSAIEQPVDDLDPIVRAIDRNKEGIGVLGDRFSGVFSTNDANGPILRGLGFFEPFAPENLGFPAGASGAQLERAKLDSVEALTKICLNQNPVACLVPYLVPGLPDFVGEGDGE
jgi:phospholipid/cholesterol/gamma-HCH transport system substrate-binding protein